MEIDGAYTHKDHENREDDAYAAAKYEITLSWLKREGLQADSRALNIGCGAGDFNALAHKDGFLFDGIEPDLEALEIAKRRAPRSSLLQNVGIFDFEPQSKYDVIVMHDVLEHIGEEAAAVQALADLLHDSPSSRAVISVPAYGWLFGLHDELLGHFRRYSRRSIRSALSSKFEILEIRSIGILGIPAALIYSRWLRKPYPIGEGGLGERIFKLSLSMEKHLCLPIGSSLLVLAKPKEMNSGN